LTIATATPRSAARRTKRKPLNTASELQLGAIEQLPRGVERGARDAAAEEHDVRHQHAAARLARHDVEADAGRQLDVAVGRERTVRAQQPARVGDEQALLEVVARRDRAARQAAHARERAVELDDVPAPGLAVQRVDVLRDHAGERAAVLHRRERGVRRVRARRGHPRPADRRPPPVACARVRVADELAVLHRRARLRVRAAVVRDARVRRAAGAGQRDDAATARERGELGDAHPRSLALASSDGERPIARWNACENALGVA
jgi:hypothetical protein